MYYNRTISKGLASLLETDGELRWLFDFVKKHKELDFLIGKNNSKEWVSIYRGLTRIISILPINSTSVFINADDKYKNTSPNLYGQKSINENFRNDIENLITKIEQNSQFDRYYKNKKEGYYQNELSKIYGICGTPDTDFVIIDKEAVIGYSNQAEKDSLLGCIQKKYKQLQREISLLNPERYGKDLGKKAIGNELDFLALDKEGNILLIEYKHGTNTSGIYLSPLQIGMYYDIFTNFPRKELEIAVFEMLEQKQKIGLINPNWEKPNCIKDIIPVLIISEFNYKSSAKTKFDEILQFTRKQLGSSFLNNVQTFNFTMKNGLSNWSSMKFKIHRGTKEIGGSCVEVWTENTRILLDFGMPLVERDGKEFDFSKFKELTPQELIEHGVLPDIKGLYNETDKLIDGVIISHPHQDHYGLSDFIDKKVKHFLGEATHKIIELNSLFTPQEIIIENATYFEKEKVFQIGDFSITPYWADHSAFDAYSFLVEAKGKSIFYSGDFRNHGRKANAFKWFTHNAPQNVDYLLLEGTTIGRESKPFKTETEIENDLMEVFQQQNKINLIYTSGQNIDRIVSIYRACIRTNKIFVVDVYVATILKELSKFAKIPFPSKEFENLKVMFPYYTSRRLKNEGHEQILYQFKNYKITKEEISNQSDKIVMIVRPSMQKDLENINEIDGGNLIYSMWEGYLQKSDTKKFIDYLTNRNFTIHKIHTSGHADTETLKQMVEAIKPKNIVPIHTFSGSEYDKIFTTQIVEMNDGETKEI